VKAGQLGVPEGELDAHGAVSEPVARAMAEGAVRALGADAAVAVTGIAGPGGGTGEKPVGTVCWAATYQGRTVARTGRFPGDRTSVRERSAQAALFLLLRLLEGRAEEGAEG
jgi:nicotinamide-nucleotide amidase